MYELLFDATTTGGPLLAEKQLARSAARALRGAQLLDEVGVASGSRFPLRGGVNHDLVEGTARHQRYLEDLARDAAPKGGFRDPKNPAQRTFWDITPEPLPGRVPNPHLEGRTPMPGTRGTGVSRARAAEVELVKRTGRGTLDWTPAEIAEIQRTGRLPPGTVGHHINDVARFPEWAGDPRNIRVVRGQPRNLAEHGGNFQNSTTGPLIDR